MLPVAAVCAPVPNDIEKTLREVLAPHFETDFGVGIRYTAMCKIRNNNSISKNTILPLLGKIIKEMNPQHQLCHDEPDLVIIVEIVQKACCLSVVKDYFEFKKYNLHEIVKKPTEDDSDSENSDDMKGAEIDNYIKDEEAKSTNKANEVTNSENTEKSKDKENVEDACKVLATDTSAGFENVKNSDEKQDENESCKPCDKEVSEISEKDDHIEGKSDNGDQAIVNID